MLLSFPSTFMVGSNLHTDLQTQQMVWKFGLKPCEQLLFLLWSKLNALIWQEFGNPNKSARLQHVLHRQEANRPFCFHGPAPMFKVKRVTKLTKGNYGQSSLSLTLIPHCWNSFSAFCPGTGSTYKCHQPSPILCSGCTQSCLAAEKDQGCIRTVRTEVSWLTRKHWMELTLPPKVVLIVFLHLEGNARV